MISLKIVFLDAKTVGNVDLSGFERFGVLECFETTQAEQTASRIEDADVVLTNKVIIGENELRNAKNLKLICVTATGTNNIDMNACAKRGVTVKNAVGYSTNSVAHITFASILSFVSHIEYFDRFVKSGGYANSDSFTDMTKEFSELASMKFCVVGLGTIGKMIYEIANIFGAKVCYYSTSGKNDSSDLQRVSFGEMLQCDIISIHCGLNEQTRNLFDKNSISKMKPSAVLANFGRGGIVCEHSIAEALNTNKIAGYITDVFEQEPMKKSSPLLEVNDKSKLLFTPHIAWASKEARIRLIQQVSKNIENSVEEIN